MFEEQQFAANSRNERALRYLLGRMTEREAVEFESEFFADNEMFEELTGLENELVDAFVRGELTVAERQEFETGYLTSPDRRENVEFARALAGHFPRSSESVPVPLPFAPPRESAAPSFFSQRPFMRIAMSAIAVAVFTMSLWLVIANRRLHREIAGLRLQQAAGEQREQILQRQIIALGAQHRETTAAEEYRMQPEGPDVVSLLLVPGMARSSAESKTLIVSPATLLVRLQLLIPHDEYPSYQASVETAEGVQIWRKSGIRSQVTSNGARSITFGVRPEALKPGDYVVKLSGVTPQRRIEDVEDYHFLIARR